MIKRRTSDDSWNILLLGLLFIAAILFFHWRENKQEDLLRGIVEAIDNEKPDNPGIKQRLKKLEELEVEAEIKPAPPPKPKPVKARRLPKKTTLNFANGTDSVGNVADINKED